MSSIQYYITLDLKRDYHQVLVMKEGDINSREIIVTIIDNGQPFDITNHLVKFKWHKPDHTYIFNDCNITENGKALINCTEQMLIVGGIAKVEVILYDDSDAKTVLSTMEFDVSIRNSVISNTDIESTDEFGALNNLILSNKDLNESLKQLEANVENAENIRISNENERISNETNRISAESQRQTDTATAITNATTATANANTATENANNATDAANTATTNANNTTKKANTAIEKMEALMKDDNIIHLDDLGAAGGVATLDENGNIPASQLPSYVDDVLEGHAVGTSLNAAGNAMCASGFILKDETEECSPESGKIYVDTDTNLQYRWTGSIYISTGSVLELGTTSSTAFPGNRGLSLENRVTDIEEYHHNIPAEDIKFDNSETSLLGANVQNVLEELSKEATPVSKGLLSAEDKKRIDNYSNVKIIPAVLLASNWLGNSAPFTQIVTVPDLSIYNNCSIELPETVSADEENTAAEAKISNITYDESVGMKFTANGVKPKIDIPIQLSVGTSINIVEVPKYFDDIPVVGVKGATETEYRNGNVNITPDDIGALAVDDDSKDNTVSFTSYDDLSPTQFNYVPLLSNGEKHSSLFSKISTMFKNIRWLYNILGTTDISAIGNGTATGAISSLNRTFTQRISELNTNLGNRIEQVSTGVVNKNYLQMLKSDWSSNIGVFRPMYNPETNIVDLEADVNINGSTYYPNIRTTRAFNDGDGNNIPNTYLKKNYVRSNIKSVNRNEYNKYFNNTWSYSGPEGAEIDAGTWLIHYYAWFSNVSGISFISIKSALDDAVGATAPVTSNGTFLEMHEISVGRNTGLPIMVYVPSPVTFGQYVSKVVAIKLGD